MASFVDTLPNKMTDILQTTHPNAFSSKISWLLCWKFTEHRLGGFNWQIVIIGSGNGWAIDWNNDDTDVNKLRRCVATVSAGLAHALDSLAQQELTKLCTNRFNLTGVRVKKQQQHIYLNVGLQGTLGTQTDITYRQLSNIRRTIVGNEIVDHSDVVGASPVGAAPTTPSYSP